MLDWLDQRLAQVETLAERERFLDAHAEPLYESLWEQLSAIAKAAQAKGFSIHSSGTGHTRSVNLLKSPVETIAASKPMNFSLLPDRRRIRAQWNWGHATFHLDVAEDGRACLKHGDAEVSVEEAGRIVMGAFLFPSLARDNARVTPEALSLARGWVA